MKDRAKKDKKKKQLQERPIDPSGNYEDMIGDSYGLTGITTGSAEQSSAEPTDTNKDVDTGNLPGGIIQGKQTRPTGIPRTAVSQKEYTKSVGQTMSSTAAQAANDIASDNDTSTNPEDTDEIDETKEDLRESNETSDEDDLENNQPPSQTNSPTSPTISGEQSVSGDMPDNESDDDTLENAHEVGEQPDEDLEHPKEIDIARDIQRSEDHIYNH